MCSELKPSGRADLEVLEYFRHSDFYFSHLIYFESTTSLFLIRWGGLWCFLSGRLDLQGTAGVTVPGAAGSWGTECVFEWPASPDAAAPLQGDALEWTEVSTGPPQPHVSGSSGQYVPAYFFFGLFFHGVKKTKKKTFQTPWNILVLHFCFRSHRERKAALLSLVMKLNLCFSASFIPESEHLKTSLIRSYRLLNENLVVLLQCKQQTYKLYSGALVFRNAAIQMILVPTWDLHLDISYLVWH